MAGVDIFEKNLTRFCEEFGIEVRFQNVTDLLRWGKFDAAVVATVDTAHVACSLPLIQAGKHVLCEKPIALSAAEGRRLVTAAEKADVINMIHFSYRNNPVRHHARNIVRSGKLGYLIHLEAHYLQTWLTSPVWGSLETPWKTTTWPKEPGRAGGN